MSSNTDQYIKNQSERIKILGEYTLAAQARPLMPEEQVEISRPGLKIAQWASDPGELEWISEDNERLNLLVELARAYVDGIKTLSSRTINPGAALTLLEECVGAIDVIYRNEYVQHSLETFGMGEQQTEMWRDMVKTIHKAAAPFFKDEKKVKLLTVANQIANRKPESGSIPTEQVSLLFIEEQLALADANKDADWLGVSTMLEGLIEGYKQDNPERFTCVLMWLKARDLEILISGQGALLKKVNEEYRAMMKQYPEYSKKYNLLAERRRIMMSKLKNMIAPLISSGSAATKEALYARMLKWKEVEE